MTIKPKKFDQQGSVSVKSALLVGVFASTAVVSGLSYVGISSANSTNYGADICVVAERLDNPSIKSKRGLCPVDEPEPVTTPTAEPTAPAPLPDPTPSATATPTPPPVVPVPTPEPTADATTIGAKAPINTVRDTAANVTAATSIVTSLDGTRVAVHNRKQAWISDDSGQTWKVWVDFTDGVGGVGRYLSAMTTTKDVSTVTLVTGNERDATSLFTFNFNLANVNASAPQPRLTSYGDSATFLAVASTQTGSKIFSLRADGYVWTTTNFGGKWTKGPLVGASPYAGAVNKLAASADGTKLVAVGKGAVWNSKDSGVTWTNLKQTSRKFTSISANDAGTKWVAAAADGSVFYSTDMGATWTPYSVLGTSVAWGDVSISANGQVIVVGQNIANGKVFFSKDGGATWNTSSTMGTSAWGPAKVSPNGNRFFIQSGTTMKTGVIE